MKLSGALLVLGVSSGMAAMSACALEAAPVSTAPMTGAGGAMHDAGTEESGAREIGRIAAERVAGQEGLAVGGAKAYPRFNDGQIMGVMMANADGQVFLGELVEERTPTEEVREYARRLVVDHAGVAELLRELSKQANIPPTQSPPLVALQQNAQETQTLLDQRTLMFDTLYLQLQVRNLATMQELVTGGFIPQADNPQLKGALDHANALTAEHLLQAQTLLLSLPRTSSGGRPTGKELIALPE